MQHQHAFTGPAHPVNLQHVAEAESVALRAPRLALDAPPPCLIATSIQHRHPCANLRTLCFLHGAVHVAVSVTRKRAARQFFLRKTMGKKARAADREALSLSKAVDSADTAAGLARVNRRPVALVVVVILGVLVGAFALAREARIVALVLDPSSHFVYPAHARITTYGTNATAFFARRFLNAAVWPPSSLLSEDDESPPLRVLNKSVCYVTNRKELACDFAPLCIDHGTITIPDVTPECVFLSAGLGQVRTEKDYYACRRLLNQYFGDAELDLHRATTKQMRYFELLQDAKIARNIPLNTVVYLFKGAAANIAHYAGRIAYLQHLISYSPQLFGYPVENVLLRMSGTVWNKTFSAQMDSWQQGMTRLVAFPLQFMDEPIHEESTVSDLRRPGIHVMPDGMGFPSAVVCYQRGIIPSFLKGRFVIPDSEIADPESSNSSLPRWDAAADREMNVPYPADMTHEMQLEKGNLAADQPSDAHILRIKYSLSLSIARPKNPFELVYLARYGRREFSTLAEWALERSLKRLAFENNLAYRKVDFGSMLTFREQMLAVQNAVVAVGLHGANLVNTVFMDARACMVEIFPLGFDHIMYKDGAGSGLGYFKVSIETGAEYEHLSLYANRNECMSKDPDCKLWYRSDDRTIALSRKDQLAIRATVTEAIRYARNMMVRSVSPKAT
ncbi:hypothetical protein FVE85_4557 [Porphyridium purpureum]|uniref:Glycosyltransferase 61 catalytic domain-containing protein n=1 Tax=Porphyridium purpureum TaxID=35688 RepID=A0A5J4YJU9_PORPP|nr:hypothetical protein FVE85_4557 [Porphyridium purpureum]|eukprot:POR6044..scf297_16